METTRHTGVGGAPKGASARGEETGTFNKRFYSKPLVPGSDRRVLQRPEE
jgi:hypothetical protein